MDNSNGQAAPKQSYSCSRRQFLLASASMAFLAACHRSDPTAAITQPLPSSTPKKYSAQEEAFLGLSVALTGKQDLDPFVSSRILAALTQLEPHTVAAIPALIAVSKAHKDPQSILGAADAAKAAALSIVSCWYTGTVGKGTSAVTVAYRDALMQRPVSDGLFPQTYAMGGPGWWVAPPPPAIRPS